VLAALLLPFAWQIFGAAVDLTLGGNELFTITPFTLLVLVGYYPFIVFFGGGLNEEPGWRGLAVPRMQRNYSPLVAGLIIGVIWSAWHFPLHATALVEGGLASFPFRFVYNVPLGVLFSWLYNRSGGNLFACVLLHASYNSASTIFGGGAALISMVLMIVFTVFVAVYDRMWRKNPAAPATATGKNPPSST
jgi:membrane protease YdiL (CAAX protease family)